MNTYLFYDIETSGLNKAFDQIIQFAAIRTDFNFNEIERHNIMVRLRPDIICSPEAMITCRIFIADSMKGVCEYEAVKQIHGLVNEFGTISAGYNSLGFDDEFLRFSFYRNLLSPYTHQFNNGCRRMDLFPVTVLFRLYKKEILSWPEHEGKASLKLEYLNLANQLARGRAHDALTDVLATVELARRLSREKEMWRYIEDYFIKHIDQSRIEQLPSAFETAAGNHRLGLLVSGEFGADLNYQIPVLSIGQSIPYGNQTLWLRMDRTELPDTVSHTIDEHTWIVRKKYGEPPIILPPLERYWNHLDKERQRTVEDNLNWLKSNTDIFMELITYHRKFEYPVIPDVDIDAALYNVGFMTRQERELCSIFHAAPLEEKEKHIHKFPGDHTRALAYRVLFRNYPDNPAKTAAGEFKKYKKKIDPSTENGAPVDYRGEQRTTPKTALLEITRLRTQRQLDPIQHKLLDELEDYIHQHFRT